MKQKSIKLDDGRELLIVERPQDASDLTSPKVGIVDLYFHREGNHPPEESYISVPIPHGNWQILGRLPEISEDQASAIVEYFTTDEDFGKEVVFRDYLEKTFHGTALESLDSLLEENGVLFENKYGKEPTPDNTPNYAYSLTPRLWEREQDKVFDKERTYLFLKEAMIDKLQEIKDQVAQEWGHTDWNDFKESLKHRLGSAHAEIDDVLEEIANRYVTQTEESRRGENKY